MPHQNVDSANAAQQNQAEDLHVADEADRGGAPLEERSYVAKDLAHATLAPPAAGELADDGELEDSFDGEAVQQGAGAGRAPRRRADDLAHGPKTRAALRGAQRRD